MSINLSNNKNIPTETEACYEIVASQEEIYLEETEEEARAILIFSDSSPSLREVESSMCDANNGPRIAESLDEQLNHAAEELVTGDSDDPPLSDEAVVDDHIASILQMEEANVRQLVSRARKHIADSRRASVSSNEQRRFLEAFVAAAQKGDMAALEGLFAEDVVSYSDGGGLVRAAGVPVSGRKRVAAFIAAVSTWCWRGVTLDWVETNGQASVLILRDGVPLGLLLMPRRKASMRSCGS